MKWQFLFWLFIAIMPVMAQPTVIVTSYGATCNGYCNGSAVALVQGGVSPYNYYWGPGNPVGNGTDSIYNLCAGVYGLTVVDALGDSAIQQISISEPSGIYSSVTGTHILCNGDSTGKVQLLIVNGGNPPYSYLWDDPGQSTSMLVTGLPAGTYTVTVTDTNACTHTNFFTLTEPPPLLMILIPDTGSGACLGMATATVSGGVPPYFIQWENGDQDTLADSLCAGYQSVGVTDNNGCLLNDSVEIPVPNSVDIMSSDQKIRIFPNPAKSRISVAIPLSGCETVKWQMYSISGILLKSGVSDLERGMYNMNPGKLSGVVNIVIYACGKMYRARAIIESTH